MAATALAIELGIIRSSSEMESLRQQQVDHPDYLAPSRGFWAWTRRRPWPWRFLVSLVAILLVGAVLAPVLVVTLRSGWSTANVTEVVENDTFANSSVPMIRTVTDVKTSTLAWTTMATAVESTTLVETTSVTSIFDHLPPPDVGK